MPAKRKLTDCCTVLVLQVRTLDREALQFLCGSCRLALCDVHPRGEGPLVVSAQYRIAITTPARSAQAVARGCSPRTLIIAAALVGDVPALARLCADYPKGIPCDLGLWVVYGGSLIALHWVVCSRGVRFAPMTALFEYLSPEQLNYLAGSGRLKMPDWATGHYIRTDSCERLRAIFAPGAPMANQYPAGPPGWARKLFRGRMPPLEAGERLALVQYFHGLGWAMGGVLQQATVDAQYADVLQWLVAEGLCTQTEIDSQRLANAQCKEVIAAWHVGCGKRP